MRSPSANDERELRLRFMDTVGEYFDVQRWGIYLLDDQSRLAEFDVQGLPDVFVERYEEIGRAVDPVMRYVVERHAPAHEQLVLTAEGWKQSELYQHCCSRYDHEHIMTGPIVGGGHIIGTVHFARVSDTPAFDPGDIADLSAICTHLSASFARLRAQPSFFNSPLVNRLTPRERQIAELVAQGLTNAEIGEDTCVRGFPPLSLVSGAALWITQNSVKQALKRMFRKLDVSARAQMVARLQDVLGSQKLK